MSFLKRAWLSITRRTGKSLLLLLIVLILGNAIAGAISIQQASANVEKKIKSDMGAAATIRLDYEEYEKLWQQYQDNPESMPTIDPPTPELMQTIGSSPYVKYYDYSTSNGAGSETVEKFTPQFLQEQQGMGGGDWDKYYAFSLRGVQYHKVLSIEEGRLNLVGGRVFTEEEITQGASVAIISKKLADANQINLNDTIVLSSFVMDYENVDANTGMPAVVNQLDYPIKVIGFVEPNTAPKTPNQSGNREGDKYTEAFMEQQTANTMYLPNGFIINFNKQQLLASMEANPKQYEGVDESAFNQTWYEPVYILNDPGDLERFKEETTPLLPELYMVATTADNYKDIAAPVEQTTKMANYILIVAVIASILIVTLVVLLFLRDRKHELGVYLSLGEKKGKVVSQIVAEVLIIALLGITLSVFTGNLVASGLSSSMIQAQMEKEAQNNPWERGMSMNNVDDYMSTNLTMQDVVSAYEIRLTPTYILVFFLVSLGTIALSTLVPMIYIVRLNPRKILM